MWAFAFLRRTLPDIGEFFLRLSPQTPLSKRNKVSMTRKERRVQVCLEKYQTAKTPERKAIWGQKYGIALAVFEGRYRRGPFQSK